MPPLGGALKSNGMSELLIFLTRKESFTSCSQFCPSEGGAVNSSVEEILIWWWRLWEPPEAKLNLHKCKTKSPNVPEEMVNPNP